MTEGHLSSNAKALHLLHVVLAQTPRWSERLLSGLSHSIDLNRDWLRVYVTVSVTASFLHLYLTPKELAPSLWLEIALAAFALLLVWWLLDWGRVLLSRNHRRPYGKIMMSLAAFGSLVLITIPLMSQGGLPTASLCAVGVALVAATCFMIIILVFLATAFHPDFAHLRMFRRWTLILQWLSGLFLFAVGAQQLLFWPKSLTNHLPPVEFLDWLLSSSVPGQIFLDSVLDLLGTILTFIILFVAINRLYRLLARRLSSPQLGYHGIALRLLLDNLRYRLTREGKQIWPNLPLRSQQGSAEGPEGGSIVEEFMFSSGIAAVSFAFGFWVPRAVPYGIFSLVPINASSRLAYVVLILFLAGGVDIWIRTIETAGLKGVMYTFGLWLGTLTLYWSTALIAVSVIGDIAGLSPSLFPSGAPVADIQNKFTFWYRAALGAITLLVAIGRSRSLLRGFKYPRTLRYGLAAVALLVLVSFVVYATPRFTAVFPFSDSPALLFGVDLVRKITGGADLYGAAVILIATVVGAVTLYNLPTRRQQESSVHPLGAQLIASPSVALAPLLFNDRIQATTWSENGYWDLSIKDVGVSPEPSTLRVYIAGSEEEVAFETLSKPHAGLRDPFDFVLTDLRTAIKIMGAEQKASKGKTQYKIIYVVATIPWKHVDVAQSRRNSGPQGMILDSGYLRFLPAERVPEDQHHPCSLDPDRCRPAAIPTVAYYAAFHGGDVDEAFLCEPFYSWLVRHYNVDPHPQPLQTISERLVAYVLMARHHLEAHPAVSYNWRRTICDMLNHGQQAAREDKSVINHAHLHTLTDFLQGAIGPRVSLHLEDVHFALFESHFEPSLAFGSPEEYARAIIELHNNKFISNPGRTRELLAGLDKGKAAKDAEQIMLQAFRETSPLVTDDKDDRLQCEGFFNHYYRADPEAHLSTMQVEVRSYLHGIAMVALPDIPGQLSELLAKLQAVESGGAVDLALIATVNLGDSALVYLLNRADLPSTRSLAGSFGRPILPPQTATDWIPSLKRAGISVAEMKAFAVPVQHQPGGLLGAVDKLRGSDSSEDINLEQVFAFPLSSDTALALLVTKHKDWERVYSWLTGQPEPPRPEPKHVEAHADYVVLKPSPRPHEQHAVFKLKLERGTNWAVGFECPGLATWTPNWGNIDSWLAEVRFDEVRLKIPTWLGWEIFAFDGVGRIPLFGPLLKDLLRGKVPGIAGFGKYRDECNWWIKSKD